MKSNFEKMELRQGSSSDVSQMGDLKFGRSSRRPKILLAVILVLCIGVALIVGLVVGLRHSENNDGVSQGLNDTSTQGSGVTLPTSTVHTSFSGPAPILLVSLDGFRASYLSYNVTLHIQQLIREGVHTPRMLSVYPTLTFPNHYTIVTGLYPESHGIVDNKMFDTSFGQLYQLGSPQTFDPKWYGGEPYMYSVSVRIFLATEGAADDLLIWLTAQRHGKRSACFFWVGSDVPINGQYPDEYRVFNGSVPFSERVDTVLEWLARPADTRPDLVTLYFNEPDHTGHAKGPGPSPEMLKTLQMVDDIVGRLIQGLKDRGLYDSVNLIIVSDHGMAARSCSRQVKLKDYFNSTELGNMYVFTSAAGRISNRLKYSRRNFTILDQPVVSTESILQRLSGHPHIAVYEKPHLPKRLHYAYNIRIDDIVLKMDDEWVVSRYGTSGPSCSGGTHGWDSHYESMSALFVARGPAFKEGVEVPPFENIELYGLMADMLNVTAAPNNGTKGSLYRVLKKPPTLNKLQKRNIQCHSTTYSPADIDKYCNCSTPQQETLVFDPQLSPFLQPILSRNESTLCFSDARHKTLYSTKFHMPLWTSFAVTNKKDLLQDEDICIVPNTNLQADEKNLYTQYSNESLRMTATALFAATSSCGSTALSSDVVPMSKHLKEDLWHELWNMVRTTANSSFLSVSVTVGPVFDYNYDGLADDIANVTRFADSEAKIPMPSHYFVILARCPNAGQQLTQCVTDLDLLSFVLPNEQNMNGQPAERRLLENVARVRDIELLTGLNFFPELDPALRAQLQIHVPMSVWTKPGSWTGTGLCSKPGPSLCNSRYQPLLLISLDGFRADYLTKYNRTPTIDKLIQCGVHAPYMRSVYPTKTFPNHYSIVTGLYPESHGIIDNNMYDQNISEKFCLSCDEAKNPAWWGGQPIWLTAKLHNLKTATYFWPGSDVAIHGEYPDYYKVYTDGVSYTQRVNTVLQWLKLPADKRPQFLTLYFDEPDHTGHLVGPDSPQIGQKLAEVDAAIAHLMEGLYKLDLHHCVNIMITADHGMSGISCDRLVTLSADISRDTLGNIYVYDGPFGRISNKYRYGRSNNIPVDPPKVNISSIVNKLECSDPHMRVYTKPQLPMRHHYTNNKRIDDILLDVDDQWLISRSGSTRFCSGGNHGYDNLYASMHALFLAHGPAFKAGIEIHPFENIELYNLMADILDVKPAPNNGTKGTLSHILFNPPPVPSIAPAASPPCSNETSSLPLYRAQAEACNCSLDDIKNVSDWSSPLGNPVTASDGPSFCIAHQSEHILAYNSEMLAPTWITFNVNMTNSTDMKSIAPCVVKDSWMSPAIPSLNATLLEGTEYVPASLLFGFHNPCSMKMASEMVPMLADFKTGIWKEVEQMVADYSVQYGEIAVTVGPVYNDDATALWKGRTNSTRVVGDVYPVPTHFFLILGKCAVLEQSLPCWESLELLSFLIPHVAAPSNCQSFRKLLIENVARVRDIEIATGLQFFTDILINQSAKLRTFLPTHLWNSTSKTADVPKPGNWTDQECPPKYQADTKCSSGYQPVLMISLDGFKPQYLHRGLTPVIDRLITCGVHAPYMRSVYPTKTFPNHYSIVTGLYPESHGIIDNNMYDFEIGNERFSISSGTKNNPRWWGGEPIWLTAQKQNLRSASYFWVGSDVPINGSYPDIFKYYTGSVPYSSRVSTIVEWMQLPASKRPDLLLLYFDEPDHQAHTSGPFTTPVDEQVQRVDRTLGELMDLLYQHDLHHCVNLILLSDHGFSYLSCDQVIQMNNYFNQTEKDELLFFYGPFGRVSNTYRRLKNGTVSPYSDSLPMSVQDVQEHLQCVDHLKVYAKTDLPMRHHYVNNDRIDNIILDPALNWTVSDKINQRYCTGGSHGWDNNYKAMEALFVGYGPAFKNGESVEPFENIELYNMVSDILGIEPSPNNGTEGSLDHLLWQSFNRSSYSASNYSMSSNSTSTAAASCGCSLDSNKTVQIIIETLNTVNTSSATQTALPFGTPLLMKPNMTNIIMLHQPTFVTAYNAGQDLPFWVSTTVSSSMLRKNTSNSCIVEDPRISSERSCNSSIHQFSNISIVSLLPSEYTLGPMASLLSSHIPMQDYFYTGVWQTLQTYLGNWSMGYQSLNIIAGSIFDGNNDGLADTPEDIARENVSVPTHIFIIASRCVNKSQLLMNCSQLQTLSFILPQVDSSKEFNCQSIGDYLVDNEARVRDVELMTDLQFFPDLPFTQAVALRTYLPSGLWPLLF